MGVDLLRGGGGRTPFLLAFFALLSVFLLFNWWSLSTDNLDLLKQIEGLTQHLKSSSSLLDQCRHDRGTMEVKLGALEEDSKKLVKKLDSEHIQVKRLEGNLKAVNNEVAAAEKKFESTNSSWKMCVTELESLKKVDISKDGVIASMRIEKTDLSNQIQELKEQVTNLNEELKKLQLEQTALKKSTLSTASVPAKVENEAGNEVKNIAEPFHAEDKELQNKGDHADNKDDQMDERELEMHGNGDDRKGALV